MRDVFTIQSGTLKVALFSALAAFGIVLYTINHYRVINNSVDPRVVAAKKAFGDYNRSMAANDYISAAETLDAIESIYRAVDAYADSFELGVIEVNRGSIYLVQVEREHLSPKKTVLSDSLDRYLDLAERHTRAGIAIYTAWDSRYGALDEPALRAYVQRIFKPHNPAFKGYDFDALFNRRLEEMREAQVEMKRRLSVAYTNLGVITRYQRDNLASKKWYERAIELWPDNHVAANNLRILHGQQIEKRGVVEQLFPKERIEKAKENMAK